MRSSGREGQVSDVSDEGPLDGALTGALNWYRAMPFSDPRVLRGLVRVRA